MLVASDYSQLELRILAHLCGDASLSQILNSDGDVFKMVAARWKRKEAEEITKEERAKMKAVVYGA